MPRKKKPLWKSWTVLGAAIYAAAAHVAPVLWPESAPTVRAIGEALGIVLGTAGARRALDGASAS